MRYLVKKFNWDDVEGLQDWLNEQFNNGFIIHSVTISPAPEDGSILAIVESPAIKEGPMKPWSERPDRSRDQAKAR